MATLLTHGGLYYVVNVTVDQNGYPVSIWRSILHGECYIG